MEGGGGVGGLASFLVMLLHVYPHITFFFCIAKHYRKSFVYEVLLDNHVFLLCHTIS